MGVCPSPPPVIAAEAAIQKYAYCRTPPYAGVTGVLANCRGVANDDLQRLAVCSAVPYDDVAAASSASIS